MGTLKKAQEAVLIECLQALDAGAGIEDCLTSFPQHAAALRPHLELRARLLGKGTAQPPAQAYAAGRRALLERLAVAAPAAPPPLWGRWLRPRLARAAVAGTVLFALAGGALGASAAAGVGQAHDVLSALHIVAPASQSGQHANPNASQGASNSNDGIGNAPTAANTGRQHANDDASNGAGNANGGREDHGTPSSGATTATPAPHEDGHGQPTDTGSDHHFVTPLRPTSTSSESGDDHGRPTSVPPAHPTPHDESDRGNSQH